MIQQSGRPIGLLRVDGSQLHSLRRPDSILLCGRRDRNVFDRQHQRLGDLAAGTLVVRDREQESPLWGESGTRIFAAPVFPETQPNPEAHAGLSLSAAGIAKLSPSDLEVLEGFFARRLDLPLATRAALARRIAEAIQAKSGLEPPSEVSHETFLEATARELRDIARMR